MITSNEIIILKEKGLNTRQIADQLNIAQSTVMYHVSPDYKKKALERRKLNNNKMSSEQREKYNQSRREYNRIYMSNRYKNDLIFREKQKERARNGKKKIN